MTGTRVPGVPWGGGDRGHISEHLGNIVRDAGSTARFVVDFGGQRFLAEAGGRRGSRCSTGGASTRSSTTASTARRRRAASCSVRSGTRSGCPGCASASVSPRTTSRASSAHRHWDEYLRRHGAGRIEPLFEDAGAAIRERLGGGFHQSGTTRMSARPEEGVVDRNLAVHGLPTLYVASSSAFPTSSQANSTFMIVVFVLRLAEHLRRVLA